MNLLLENLKFSKTKKFTKKLTIKIIIKIIKFEEKIPI